MQNHKGIYASWSAPNIISSSSGNSAHIRRVCYWGQHPSIISCCLKISLNSPLSSVALLKLYKLLWFGNEHSHGKEFIKARNNGNVGQGPVVVSLPAFTNSTASSVSKASTTSRSLRLGQPCWRINSGGFPVHGTRRPPEA